MIPISTFFQIKQKRLEMSHQENKPFQWDDAKVVEFFEKEMTDRLKWGLTHDLAAAPPPIQQSIKSFKSSHSSSEKVDWEIVCMVHNSKLHDTYFKLKQNGKFSTEDYPEEEFDLYDDLINNKIGKTYSIHSVRRLSDNTVWTINDKNHDGLIITHFKITDGDMYAHFAPHADHDKPLSSLKKAPIPEDIWFLRIKDGDCNERNGYIGYYKEDLNGRSKSGVYKWFPSKEAAAKYWEAIGHPPPLVPVYLTQPQIDKLIAMLGGEGI